MDSLNNYESLILLKFLNVKHNMLAVARCRQKTIETPAATYALSCQPLGHCTERHRLHKRLDLSGLPRLVDLRLVRKPQIQCWQAGRCIAKWRHFGNGSRQNKMVGMVCHAPDCRQRPYAWYSACCDLRASSRSTVFIIEDGPVSAFLFRTVR